jgi:hypothetical protein
MLPGKYNIEIFRGSTWSIAVNRATAAGVPINWETTYLDVPSADAGGAILTVRPGWQVRPEDKKITALLTLSQAAGDIVMSGTSMVITVKSTVSALFTFNEGVYDLEVFTGGSVPVVHKALYGRVTIRDEQT